MSTFFSGKAAQANLSELFASSYTAGRGKGSVCTPARHGGWWGGCEKLPGSGWCWQQSLGQVSWDDSGWHWEDGEAPAASPTTLEPSSTCFALANTALLWVTAVINAPTAAILPSLLRHTVAGDLGVVRCPAYPFPKCRKAMLEEAAFPFPTW